MSDAPVFLVVNQDLDVEEHHQYEWDCSRGDEPEPEGVDGDVEVVLSDLGVLYDGDPVLLLDRGKLQEPGAVDEEAGQEDGANVIPGLADHRVGLGIADAKVTLQRYGQTGIC